VLERPGARLAPVHEVRLPSGLSIACETFGEPGDPPVLLVMGFGTQMIGWHEDFCAMLAGRGRYVIRYDNRDCGLSSRFDDRPVDMGGQSTPEAQQALLAPRPSDREAALAGP
jgi:pimeloyl-ACP methyl ester carboxylesterase